MRPPSAPPARLPGAGGGAPTRAHPRSPPAMPTVSPTIFREYDIRGLVDQDLTDDAVNLIGRALGTLVRRAGGGTVVVGRDCRLSGERFARQVTAGLTSTGVDVVDLGVVPTPLTYFAAHTLRGSAADGLCMITGSH